jgi:predicted nuclease of predicted toxin-antitoxin system
MRLLADECCPRAVVEGLRQAGHDVVWIADSHGQISDRAVLSLAQSEDRILLTEDFDFGDLLIRDRMAAPGAIILHMPGATPLQRSQKLIRVLNNPDIRFEGHLAIIDKRRVRLRPLPRKP